MSKPDEIVEEMKRLQPECDSRLIACRERWRKHAKVFIPHSLKLLAEKDKEIERLRVSHHEWLKERVRALETKLDVMDEAPVPGWCGHAKCPVSGPCTENR